MTEKSEQEIIEEIINSVKSRKFRAWIHNIVFNKDDWEDDFDTTIEAIEALNDALDDNGRKDCDWGIDEVKTYNQIEIELAVKKALQKGKELGILSAASQMPKSLAKGTMNDTETKSQCKKCGVYCEKSQLRTKACDGHFNDVGSKRTMCYRVQCSICPDCFYGYDKKQASKIAELEKENKELLETLQSVLCQACESRVATDTEPPEYDSVALSAYADGLRLLSKYKRFRIHSETGRRVIGYMR